jgi:hypothetical protein
MNPDHVNVESLGNVVPHPPLARHSALPGRRALGMPIWTTPLSAMPDHGSARPSARTSSILIRTVLMREAASMLGEDE